MQVLGPISADMPSDPHLEGQTRIFASQPAFSYWKSENAVVRERGSVLYLGMATEFLNLPWLCIT